MGASDLSIIKASWRDPEVFSELFRRHFGFVRAYCARRGGLEGADDLAGETFRIAFERRRTYDITRLDARPWLLGIAHNTMRNSWRSQGRERAALARLAHLPPDVVDPAALAVNATDARSELAVLAAGLESLPLCDVDALLLHVWEGLSYTEVAAALDIPVGTVGSRISRVRSRLRELLEWAPDDALTHGLHTRR
jgi:RNA polymerase sigma-70 factor (ECF subfamily)